MNYLMCYFCSPEQSIWYVNDQARICSNFCEKIYKECSQAEFQKKSIGQQYQSGMEFCQGQRFFVSEGESNCFNYDPTVFGQAAFYTNHLILLLMCCLLSLLVVLST